MKKNHLLSLLAGLSLCAASCGGPTAETDAVIPRPASVEKRSGACRLASPLALSFDAPAEVADALTAYLRTTPLADVYKRQEQAAVRFCGAFAGPKAIWKIICIRKQFTESVRTSR